MKVVTGTFRAETRGNTDIVDITGAVEKAVADAGITDGTALVFVPGATAGITTIEYEPGLLQDLPAAFEKLAPAGARYAHDDTWHDGNGHSHVRAALLGASFTVPVTDGRPVLGTWQQVVLVDFDNRARTREITVQTMGA